MVSKYYLTLQLIQSIFPVREMDFFVDGGIGRTDNRGKKVETKNKNG